MPRPIAFTRPDQRQDEYVPWSDDDLHTMSEVTEQDIEKARQYWQRALPARWRDLMEAQ